MHIAVINDCRDDNVVGRQLTRIGALTGATTSFVGVGDYGDLEAAGNIIDILDAFDGKEGALLVNVAPRHKGSQKWSNGTPFGYFWINGVLILSSIDGATLSLVKKFGLTTHINVLDITVCASLLSENGITGYGNAQRIPTSQFRSFDFLPRMATYLLSHTDAPHEVLSIDEVPDAPKGVWWVDNFGNCKTTLLPEDMGFQVGSTIQTKLGELVCIRSLKDVEKGIKALIIGSSGLGDKRFLEIVVQGGRASDELGVSSGTLLVD